MKYEAHRNIGSEVDEHDIYDIDKWILKRNNDVSVHLKAN